MPLGVQLLLLFTKNKYCKKSLFFQNFLKKQNMVDFTYIHFNKVFGDAPWGKIAKMETHEKVLYARTQLKGILWKLHSQTEKA